MTIMVIAVFVSTVMSISHRFNSESIAQGKMIKFAINEKGNPSTIEKPILKVVKDDGK